jgi:hypothetical protein
MFRSDPDQIFFQKYWPLIFFFGITTIIFWKIGFRWGQLVFLVPFFLLSLFRASLAVVEAEDESIRYRRLSVWRQLSFDEVTSCGPSKAGLEIGYIRLKRFLWPWGNLYFILDEPTPRGMDLVTFIRKHTRRP